MPKKEIKQPGKENATGAYSAAVEVDGWVYVSGQGPVDLKTAQPLLGTIEEETTIVLRQIESILGAAGCSPQDIVKCTVHLADMQDFDRYNAVYREFFKSVSVMPARTTVQSVLWKGIKVEIDCVARKPAPSAAHPQSFAPGPARRCVNPPPNISHGGWGAQRHEQAEGIDMDFWATALALSDGPTTALVLDIDIQILTNQRAAQIRAAVSQATRLPLSNIRASATHTHSGPTPYKSWIEKGYEMVDPWFDNLTRWCAEAAREALSALQPVTVRVGRGRSAINANRRSTTPTGELFLGINPDGPCDREVGVILLDGLDKNPVATLVNYACHATIMGPANRLLTPDYPGAMKRVVEEAVGGRCLFLQGAAGDQGPVQGFQADPTVYRALGAALGHEASRVALELRSVPTSVKLREVVPSGAPLGMYGSEFRAEASVPLRVVEKEIPVPVRSGLPERKVAAEALEKWKDKLKSARAHGDDEAAREATYLARRADLQLRMAEDFGGKSSTGVLAHFLTFGNVALVGCNIEPFCEIGLSVKKHSPFTATFMSGYTNGRLAYMATAEEWPKGGYEVDNSPFAAEAAGLLTQQILATLAELKAKPGVAV